jgi:hypothetical protein
VTCGLRATDDSTQICLTSELPAIHKPPETFPSGTSHTVRRPNILPIHLLKQCCFLYDLLFFCCTTVKLSNYRPGQALRTAGGWGSQNFLTNGARTWQGCQSYAPVAFTPRRYYLVLVSVKRLSWPQGHSAAVRIKSMKNFNYPTVNRTHDLPTCSVVPQPTAPTRTPQYCVLLSSSTDKRFYTNTNKRLHFRTGISRPVKSNCNSSNC